MLYINERDWLDIIFNRTSDPVVAEHVIALAKLRMLAVCGADGWEYLPSFDDDGTWAKVPYIRPDEDAKI
jgi:hypothetical protein